MSKDHQYAAVPLIEVNNKEADSKLIEKDNEAPVKDRFMMVYLTFLLHGMAILLPWNIFITAGDYFVNYKLNTDISRDEEYTKNFLFYISIVGQVSNVIMNAMNMFCRCGGNGNPKGRMPYAIMLCSLVLIFTIVLAILDTSKWPFGFFITTIVSVVVTFLATGIYNTCTFYVVSMFPMQYTNAIIFGNNISGIFTTLMSIISKATSPDHKIAAIYYFLSGVILLLVCFILYFAWPHMKFYRYYERIANEKEADNKDEKHSASYVAIIKKTWVLLFSIWLAMFSTLAIFPVYQTKIKRSSENFFISETWFTDITCFLTFNIFITLGNFLTEFIRKPGPKWVVIPVVLKAVLSVLFVAFCNFDPASRKNIPVLITNDYVYWAGSAIIPLVSGYLISLLMMYVPKQVEGKNAGTAAMLSALVLVIGVVTGLQFSRFLEMIVLL